MECKKCGEAFQPRKGLKSYCSLACRNSRTRSNHVKNKIRASVLSTLQKQETTIEYGMCGECSEPFVIRPNRTTFCSRVCASRNSGRLGGLKSATRRVVRSKNEIMFYEMCSDVFSDVTHNDPIFDGWDADVIIHDMKLAILWNGKWHYEQITKEHSLKQVQNRDKIKIKKIIECGYIPYIIKDMGKHNPDFVRDEFQKLLRSREVVIPEVS